MSIAVNWKISTDLSTLICYTRSLSTNERKIFNFRCLDIIIIDTSEALETLSDVYSTSQVTHLSSTFYKVICERELTESARPDMVRSLYVVPVSIYSMLHATNMSYNQVFDDQGMAILPSILPSSKEGKMGKMNIISPRKTIVWDLEVIIPQHEGFPTSKVDPVIMASFCSSDYEKKVHIYTTINKKYIANIEDISVTIFDTELQLCEALLEKICEHDLDIEYNGKQFDWPYLINRLLLLRSSKLLQLGSVDGSVVDIGNFLGQVFVMTFNGPSDHVDMLPFMRAAYGYFSNHKLDTVTTNLLNQGKTGFSISTIRHITNRLASNPEPTQELIELVSSLVKYSAKDAEITQNLWNNVKPVYEYLVEKTNISYSQVGTGEEAMAILLMNNPELLREATKSVKRIPSPYMTPGRYTNVNMFTTANLFTESMLQSEDALTKKYGAMLQDHFMHTWIVNLIFQHPQLKPKPIKVDQAIGFSPGYIYLHNDISGTPLNTYPSFVVISTGSWIIKNKSFSYHGLSGATRHPFKAVRTSIEKYILEGKKDTSIGGIDDVIMTAKVTSLNLDKYRAFLNESQVSALHNSDTPWIKIEYVHLVGKKQKKVSQLTSADIIDTAYYKAQILKILNKF